MTTNLNPLTNLTTAEVGERLARILSLRPEKLDVRLAARRPDLWGRDATWQIECLRELPADLTVLDLVKQLSEEGGPQRLGFTITLRTDDGQVVASRDTLRELLRANGLLPPP